MSRSHSILTEEDEEIEKVKALSLITAQEDELRRSQLYHSVETIPQHVANERTSLGLHASSSFPNLTDDLTASSTANTIVRPRPQGKVVGSNTFNLPVAKPRPAPRSPRKDDSARRVPMVPPRPSKAVVSPPSPQPSSHHDDLLGRTGLTASGLPPRPSERTLAGHALQQKLTHPSHSTPPKADIDKPLITLSPSFLQNPDDFDVSSLDPLNRPCSSDATSSHTSFAADMDVPSNPPGGTSVPFSMSGTVAAPLFASSSSFGMAATPSYPPHGSSGSGTVVTFYPPSGSTGSRPVVPSRPPRGSTGSVPMAPPYTQHDSTSSGPMAPSYPPRSSIGSGPMVPSYPLRGSTGSVPVAPSHPLRGSTGSGAVAPSLPPTGPFYPACDNAFTGNNISDKPFVVSNALYVMGMTASTDTPQADGHVTASASQNTAQMEEMYDSDDDLMQFAAGIDHEDFLSLESFDPLYSMEQLTPVDDATNAVDSIELFPNPYDKFERKETPNPFPVVDPASTQKILRQSGVYTTTRLSRDVTSDVKVDEQPSASTQGHSRNESTGSNSELMDPFSVSNLTKVLERKRRKHEEEQRERVAQMKEKEAKLKDEKMKPGRETFSRQTSYLSKGQVRQALTSSLDKNCFLGL